MKEVDDNDDDDDDLPPVEERLKEEIAERRRSLNAILFEGKVERHTIFDSLLSFI